MASLAVWVSCVCCLYRLTHTGQLLNGLGGTVAMAGPPVMSSVWFPVHQRTTATGFSSAMNNLGVAVAFIIGTCAYASDDSALLPARPCPKQL